MVRVPGLAPIPNIRCDADLPHALNLACGFIAICAITKFSNAALPQSNDNSIDSLLVITHGTFSVKSPRARPRPRLVRGSISPKASCFLGPAKLPRDGAGGGSSLERESPLSS